MKRKREWSFVFFGIFVLLCGAYGGVFSHVLCNPKEIVEKIFDCPPIQDIGPPVLLGYEREALRLKEKASKGEMAAEMRRCFPVAIPGVYFSLSDGFEMENDDCWQPEMFGGEQ